MLDFVIRLKVMHGGRVGSVCAVVKHEPTDIQVDGLILTQCTKLGGVWLEYAYKYQKQPNH